jgi:hypothetical protein
MQTYNDMQVLPTDIQSRWRAGIIKAMPTERGTFALVDARATKPGGFQEQRIIVRVVDENGFPMAGVTVAFSFSTAGPYLIPPDSLWSPPAPHRAFITPTTGSGECDQIQGSGVKDGEPGGVSVYIFEPEYSSDIVTGAGMLANHTGLMLTFQLRRVGVRPLAEWLTEMESRVAKLENDKGRDG